VRPTANLRRAAERQHATAGAAYSPALQVSVAVAGVNVVPSATVCITLSISTNRAGGVLGGLVTLSTSSGVATFTGVSID
jgi:hypothetical protein